MRRSRTKSNSGLRDCDSAAREPWGGHLAGAAPPAHLFVYGTLRRGGAMHALLEPGAEWVGPARLRGRLYDLGAFPGMVEGRAGDVVTGELYRLAAPDPERLLDALDRYEGRAFRRVAREAELEGGARVAAFVYLFAGSTRGHRRIASGDYLADTRDASRAAPAGRRA